MGGGWGHLIEVTVLIVVFMKVSLGSFSLLNNLSPRQLLNQALSLLSCHKDTQWHNNMWHIKYKEQEGFF